MIWIKFLDMILSYIKSKLILLQGPWYSLYRIILCNVSQLCHPGCNLAPMSSCYFSQIRFQPLSMLKSYTCENSEVRLNQIFLYSIFPAKPAVRPVSRFWNTRKLEKWKYGSKVWGRDNFALILFECLQNFLN